MTKIKTVCVDKVVYEAVLRNSIRVIDLEAENQRLKELLKECRDVIKDVDTYCTKNADEVYILTYKIDNTIGEKQ